MHGKIWKGQWVYHCEWPTKKGLSSKFELWFLVSFPYMFKTWKSDGIKKCTWTVEIYLSCRHIDTFWYIFIQIDWLFVHPSYAYALCPFYELMFNIMCMCFSLIVNTSTICCSYWSYSKVLRPGLALPFSMNITIEEWSQCVLFSLPFLSDANI